MGRSGSGRSRSGGWRGDPRGVRRALDPAGCGCCPGSRGAWMLPWIPAGRDAAPGAGEGASASSSPSISAADAPD